MASTLKKIHILKSFKWTVGARAFSGTQGTHLRLNFSSLKCRKLLFNHKIFPSLGCLSSTKNLSNTSFEKHRKELGEYKPIEGRDHGLGNDTEEIEGFEEEEATKGKVKLLSETLTPELEKEILDGKSALKIKNVHYEIVKLETKRYPFPLPPELTIEQWRTLLSFDDRVVRMYYLDSLRWEGLKWQDSGEEFTTVFTLEELRKMDSENCNPLGEQVSEEMIAEAVGQDEEGRRRINLLLLVHEMERQKGERMPLNITVKDLKTVADEGESERQITKYLNYMTKKEFRKISNFIVKRNTLAKNEPQSQQRLKDIANEKHIFYGLGENAIMIRMDDSTMDRRYNWEAIREFYDWGQPLVIDLSFLEQYRTTGASLKSLIYNEVPFSITNNRTSKAPFALHFTGVSEEMKAKMEKAVPGVCNLTSSVNVTSENAIDMWDPERLVYLSPDSRNDLKEINPDDVYVIGGIIDKHDRKPLTLSRAKRQGIRHARFPMKRIINLKAELNVDTCVAIMCDMKATQDWFYSLRWVPSRLFANRLKDIEAPSLEHQLAYRAHRALSPTVGDIPTMTRMRSLTPRKYREMYQRIAKATSREEMDKILLEAVI